MKTVQPFIDLGFFVVPMDGDITRDRDGKKTIPKFRGAWKELYFDEPYNPINGKETIALTGAFITGLKSGAVSIDCDNIETYQMFKTLDPDYKFEFISKDKKEGGASIIYAINDKLLEIKAFRMKNDIVKLDYQTDNLLQFLPTSGNKSKVEWEAETFEQLPELREPPDAVVTLLKTLSDLNTKSKSVVDKDGNITHSAIQKHYKHLAPFIIAFLQSGKFNPELFRILTPKKGGFTELPQYKRDRTLHPDSVPDGMGNDYITSVAGVLVCDSSISPKLFKEFLLYLNTMWSNPYPVDRMNAVIKYQLSRDKWVYNKDWKEMLSVILTDYNTLVSIFYDPITRIYYCIDNNLGASTFNTVDAVPRHLNSIVQGGRRYKTSEIYDYLDKKRVILSAKHPYGEVASNGAVKLNKFNMFNRSKAYSILLDPNLYENEFKDKTPHTTIAFFEHLIPDKETRDYILRFILTKLQTASFSEVILYLLGAQGAGKNLFVDWLALLTKNNVENAMIDYQLVVEVDLENFLSKYNLWITNALFANLDEYGEKTSGHFEDKKVLAQLKSYTGKESIQLRTMNNDPLPSNHRCTFILTANENRLSPDLEDRRIVLIDSPEALRDASFVMDLGGKSEAIKKLWEEQELFCYWWAQNYTQLDDNEYRTPPDTAFKRKLIVKHLPISKKIALAIKEQDRQALIDLCEDAEMLQELMEDAKYGAISKHLLVAIYECVTEGTKARKSMLDNALRDFNLSPIKVRFGKTRNTYAYEFIGLKDWANKHQITEGILLASDLKI